MPPGLTAPGVRLRKRRLEAVVPASPAKANSAHPHPSPSPPRQAQAQPSAADSINPLDPPFLGDFGLTQRGFAPLHALGRVGARKSQTYGAISAMPPGRISSPLMGEDEACPGLDPGVKVRCPQPTARRARHLFSPASERRGGFRGFGQSYIFRAMRAASSMASQAVRALTQSPMR